MRTDFRKYANVQIGKDSIIGDYAILGLPSTGGEGFELVTKIGDNAYITKSEFVKTMSTPRDLTETRRIIRYQVLGFW